jgi:hypothetical protein
MKPSSLRYVYYGGGIVVIALGLGLLLWYLFLRGQIATLNLQSSGRGFDSETPRFSSNLGSTFTNTVTGNDFGVATQESVTQGSGARLRPVHQTPTAGHVFRTNTSTLLYIERATGHVFAHEARTDTTTRKTNALFPRTYEARGAGNGVFIFSTLVDDAPVMRVVTVDFASATPEFLPITERILPSNVLDARVNPQGNGVLLTIGSPSGGVQIAASNIDGSSLSTVFSSRIRGWALSWLRNGSVFVTERAATDVLGTGYELGDGQMIPIARRVPGLTLLPAPVPGIALVGTDDGQMRLGLQKEGTFIELPLRTLADKCAWAPTAASSSFAYCAVPDTVSTRSFVTDWYQGRTHSADTLWQIAPDGSLTQLFTSTEAGTPLDMERLEVDDRGEYVAFRNAIDKSLWIFRIQK